MSTWLDDYLATDVGTAHAAQTEIVVDRRTGRARQAGATHADGAFVQGIRLRAEASLFVFAKGIMGRTYLTKALHRPICEWLQRRPPMRKLLLLPREHGKSTLVGHCLPIHILIQPAETNAYFPGEPGCEQRIILAGETAQRATDALRVVETAYESNELLRAFWPHLMWDSPRQESKKWNEFEMIVRRENEWPDPSIRAIGVGGAITGAHPSVLLKDDLVTIDAANSPTVMQDAIHWHIASRALINRDNTLEFVIGTRWAVADLYDHIITHDPTVEVTVRSVVEAGECIYPEMFDLAKVGRLQKEFGVLFPLLYMNSAADPELTDFDLAQIRSYAIADGHIELTEDDRDVLIAERMNAPAPTLAVPEGAALTRDTWMSVYRPGEGFRLRGG